MVSIEMEGLSRGVGELEIRYQSSLFEKVMLEKEKKEQSTINDGL